jgi:hypothetical protein
MIMRKLVGLPIVLAMLVLPAMAADEQPPTLARNYSISVKAGHEAEFEDGMEKQMEWYKKNSETWHWHTWQWETGENTGKYLFRSPGHYWKDMDDRSERTARARAHFQEVAGPHVESMTAGISRVLPTLSNWPAEIGTVPMVSVYELNVHYGMSDEFVHTIGKIHEVLQETDWPVHYAWSTTISGGEMPTFFLVIPHKNWADMQGPDKSLWAMLEETIGRAETDALKASLTKCVREEHTSLARLRPELSYFPEQ